IRLAASGRPRKCTAMAYATWRGATSACERLFAAVTAASLRRRRSIAASAVVCRERAAEPRLQLVVPAVGGREEGPHGGLELRRVEEIAEERMCVDQINLAFLVGRVRFHVPEPARSALPSDPFEELRRGRNTP